MLLGTITGKVTTSNFSFISREEPKNFEFVQVYHRVYDYVLCQIIEVTKDTEKTLAFCQVIGYNDAGRIKRPRIPFDPNSEVLRAEDDFISSVISLGGAESKSAIIGQLSGRTIPVPIDLNKVLTKHVAILAKSGAGKSYSVGVLLEEIIERGVPVIIIDPHGEYASLASPNTNAAELEEMPRFGIEPKAYPVAEYADQSIVPNARPLRITTHLTAPELTHLLPGKLSANQQAILYSALKNLKNITFDSLLGELDAEESPAKYSIISTIEYLRSLSIFSAAPTPYSELVRPGQATVINLKGIAPDVQEIIVYKLCKDLFSLRKENKVSPFFLVIEEAHNYCPERSFGETKSSKILRDIASEGRKFGLGLCVVSQRPARVDKSVLSQCSTQIILKVTNPNDLKAMSASIEGLTSESEKEIKHLAIGSALVTGVTEVPLFVTVRPRKTAHGGRAVDIIGESSARENSSLLDRVQEFQTQEVLPIIKPLMTPHDLEVMSDGPVSIHSELIPAYQFMCREGEDRYKVLVEMERGRVIIDKESFQTKILPRLDELSPRELKVLQTIFVAGGCDEQTLLKKVGGSLEVHKEMESLMEKEYVFLKSGVWKANDDILFSRLRSVANFDEIVYEASVNHQKRTASLSVDQVREHLNTFTTVEDQFECYVVRHTVRGK